MKLIRNNTVVLHVANDYVIIMKKTEPSAYDPASVYWGLAQGFKVVTDLSTNTFVLVPLGTPTRVARTDFGPCELDEA